MEAFFSPSYTEVDATEKGGVIYSPTIGMLQTVASAHVSAEIFPDDPILFSSSEQFYALDNQTAYAEVSADAQLSDILTVFGLSNSPITIRIYLTGFGSVDSESQVENGPLPGDNSNGFAYININAQPNQGADAYSTVRLSDYNDGSVTYSTDIGNTTKGGSILGGGFGGVYQFSAYVDVIVTAQNPTIKITEQGVANPAISGDGTIHDNFEASLSVGAPSGITVTNSAGDLIEAAQVACYCADTHILTVAGEVKVEALAPDDIVVTASGQHRPIKWIGRRSYTGRFLAANPGVQPIRFRNGSLGDDLPRRDLLVSPEHAMFLDGLLIPARCLVNGSSIVRDRVERVDYCHIELDSHDVLLAEGAPSESFMDDDSRGMFHNAHEFAALYPGAPRPDGFCAPRLEQRAALEAIRQRLAGVAGEMAQAA